MYSPLCSHSHTYPCTPPCAVTPLDVLPSCEYKSLYAKPHKIKPYQGVYEVRESYVEPKDDTWYKHWRKNDKGNPTIKPEVCDKGNLTVEPEVCDKGNPLSSQWFVIGGTPLSSQRHVIGGTPLSSQRYVIGGTPLSSQRYVIREPHC